MDRQEEVEIKLEKLRTWLKEEGIGSLLIGSQANFAWLTGGGDSHISLGEAEGVASLLVTPDKSYLLTSNIEMGRLLQEELDDSPFEPVATEWFRWYRADQAKQVVSSLCDINGVLSDLGSLGLPLVPDTFGELRYTLLPPELERYRSLGADAKEAVETVCTKAEPGDSELEVAASLAFECQSRNIIPLVTLVAGDERISRYRHPLPTGDLIKRNLLVALTGRRHGLHVSLTRLVSFIPLEPDLERRHRAITEVDARLILESQEGAALEEILQKGKEQYSKSGFPEEWQMHHQGGLTGYSGREIFAGTGSKYRLKVNQAVAWNPSIAGTKSEDTVLVSKDGPEILTRSDTWPEVQVKLPMGAFFRPSILVR